MAKSKSRPAAAVAAKIKTAASFSPKAFKRLGAASVYYDRTQSDLLEELVNDRFAGFKVVIDQAKSSAPVMVTTSVAESQELESPMAISA